MPRLRVAPDSARWNLKNHRQTLSGILQRLCGREEESMTPTVDFTELGHIYRTDDGVIVPSVSQVLTLAGISDMSGIPQHVLDRARAIGTAVHQACEYLDQDDLDLD